MYAKCEPEKHQKSYTSHKHYRINYSGKIKAESEHVLINQNIAKRCEMNIGIMLQSRYYNFIKLCRALHSQDFKTHFKKSLYKN